MMALRQILLGGCIRNFGKLSNLDFVARQRVSTNNVRFIRSKGHRDVKQSPRRYIPSPNEININSDILDKTFMFAVAFTAGSFVSVTIWEYEQFRIKVLNSIRQTNDKINPMGWLKIKQEANHRALQAKQKRLKNAIYGLWAKLTPGEKIFAPILLINVVVYGLWRLPQMRPFMLKYFARNSAAKAVCWPMFLSTFSHYSLIHLLTNMYVLHSFSVAEMGLGKEQFLGLYLSAGVISSFASFAFKIATASPGYSLGASGAIMAILAYFCAHYPDTKLSILFIPQLQISASSAIQALMCFDFAGLIFRWKKIDHVAHLVGALVGLLWSFHGQKHLWPLRENIAEQYRQARGKLLDFKNKFD